MSANAGQRPITKKQIALIHIAKSQCGMDEETYRAMLGSVGCASSKELTQRSFDDLLRRFKRGGFRQLHVSARKSGMDRPPAPDREPLLGKISALLTDQKLPWSYADGIANRMWGVELVRWATPEQLRAVVAALVKRGQKAGKAGESANG